MRPSILPWYLPVCGLLWMASCVSASGTRAPAESSARVQKPFLGQWTGTLQYRDYTSDKRVSLPTRLEVTPGPEGTSLRFAYVYDDGPGKTVTEESTVVIDPAARQMTVASEKGTGSVYRFAEDADLKALEEKGQGVFMLSGEGVENDQPVAVRLTLEVDGGHYRLLRETQAPGAPLRFRHEYSFTRAGEGARAPGLTAP